MLVENNGTGVLKKKLKVSEQVRGEVCGVRLPRLIGEKSTLYLGVLDVDLWSTLRLSEALVADR